MTCQIKSTRCLVFLGLIAGVLMLSGGCFDTSSNRAEGKRDRSDDSGTVRRIDRNDLAQRNVVTDTDHTPNEVIDAAILTATVMDAVPTETTMPTKRQISLPATIDWSIPTEQTAAVEGKIAADIAETAASETVSDWVVDTVDPSDTAPEPVGNPVTVEQTVQGSTQEEADDNPFANIGESQQEEFVMPLPVTDVTIDETIWEKAQPEDHEALEDLAITQEDKEKFLQMFRPKQAGHNEVTDSQETNGDAVTQPSDTDWQAVEPEPGQQEPGQQSEQVVPVVAQTHLLPMPNTQTDGDPFGIDAADAFEQFGQTVGDTTTTPEITPTPPSTPPSAPPSATPLVTPSATTQEDAGFDEDDFWNNTDDFKTDDDTSPFGDLTSPFDVSDDNTAKTDDTTETPSQQPATPVRPMQPQPTPGTDVMPDADDLGVMGPLTPVEQYIVNEAKASPIKLMESVELLYKLNKPLLVRRLLRQLTGSEMSAEDCQQICKRINPAIMLRISLDAEYQPEGGMVVRKIVDGSQSYFESRGVIETAMQKLLTGTDREKDDAIRTILSGSETSMEYLLERLAASTDQNELSEVMSLLNAMGESSRRALQESLVTTTPLGMRAARLLTQMGRASDSRFLLPMMFDSRLSDDERREMAGMVQTLTRNIPDQESAAATLYSMASNYFRGKVPFMTDADNNVPLWILRDGNELPKFVTMAEADASRYFAEKFARFATCLDPRKPAYRQLWLVAFFDLKGAEIGSDNSITLDENLLQAMITGLTVDDVESALRFAMQQEHPIAARVAAELMGEFGDAEAVIYKRGSQSALVKAVGFSDRRVRFAALQSIMKLQPDRPYPGSSVVTQSLVYFTRATGKKRAVVVSPWLGDATSVAGLLEPLGYTSEVATMGRQAMQLAIDSADTELMMLDVRTPSSNVEFLVQDMRADNRTHDVPIAVLANGWVISRAERAAYGDNRISSPNDVSLSREILSPKEEKNRMTIGDDDFIVNGDQMAKAERAAYGSKMAFAFPRPYDEASAKFVIENLLRESGVEHVPPQLRLAEAKRSIQWVTDLYKQPKLYRFENIEQIAWDTLWLPELTDDTLPLVELIPTANAQRMLTHIVSTPAFAMETRRAALQAFETNARSYGVLIRGRQILDLYDMYNASGTEPVASQQARSDLLDVVEKYANYMQNVSYQK